MSRTDPLGFQTPLVDWFFEVKALRPALEKAAKKTVERIVWLEGDCNPLDPEPWRWQRAGHSTAVLAKRAPGKSAAARKGHLECGLDSLGRLVTSRQYVGTPKPYLNLYFFLPPDSLGEHGRVRGVRYPTDDYRFSPPEMVVEFLLDGAGQVVHRESYANLSLWPAKGEPTEADREALKNAPPHNVSHLRVNFEWRGNEFIGADDGLVYDREQGLERIWRKNHTRASGIEVRWKRGKRKGWPFVV